jgi:hypothetical protein
VLQTIDGRNALVVDDAVPREFLPYLFQTFGKGEERCGFPLPTVNVFSDCSHAMSDRNFAGIVVGRPSELFLCDDLLDQPVSRIRGVLWHELGHVIDKFAPGPWRKYSGCKGLDEEQWTDAAVETFCGVKIYYDEDLVQRVGPGHSHSWTRPRPRGLR